MYKRKESFQNSTSGTSSEVKVIASEPITVQEAQVHLNTIGPVIAANPEMQGVFNSDKGIDLSQVDLEKAKTLSTTIQINTTVPTTDIRPSTDITKQCDIAKVQLASIQANINAYKASNSWAQVRALTASITPIQDFITSSGC